VPGPAIWLPAGRIGVSTQKGSKES
jgi:hypothetical protein